MAYFDNPFQTSDESRSKGSGLRDLLANRALEVPKWEGPTNPTGLPAPPPNPSSGVPPAWQRYKTGLEMQDAYANGWSPNPILVRILRGR